MDKYAINSAATIIYQYFESRTVHCETVVPLKFLTTKHRETKEKYDSSYKVIKLGVSYMIMHNFPSKFVNNTQKKLKHSIFGTIH